MMTYQANTNQWKDALGCQGGKGFSFPISREFTIQMQGVQSAHGLQLLRPSGSISALELRPYSFQLMTKHEGVLQFCHFCSWKILLGSHLHSRVSHWFGQELVLYPDLRPLCPASSPFLSQVSFRSVSRSEGFPALFYFLPLQSFTCITPLSQLTFTAPNSISASSSWRNKLTYLFLFLDFSDSADLKRIWAIYIILYLPIWISCSATFSSPIMEPLFPVHHSLAFINYLDVFIYMAVLTYIIKLRCKYNFAFFVSQ